MDDTTKVIIGLFSVILIVIGFIQSIALDAQKLKSEQLWWQVYELEKERRNDHGNSKDNRNDSHRIEREDGQR
jgi:hypothetical protein